MIIRDLDSQLRFFKIVLKFGIVLFPSYFFLDHVYYPDYKFELLAIRLCLSAYFLFVLFMIPHVSERYQTFIICFTFFLTAFVLSLMCFVTGDGLSSIYCFAILQVILVSVLMFNMKPKYYVAMIVCILAQHFALLGFLPWSLRDIMVNVFGVASFAVVGGIIHYFIHNAVNEIRALRGIIPICANCKKIRDDEGYWHQVESYVAARSDAVFSHGICPDCMQLLYPDLAEEVNADSK